MAKDARIPHQAYNIGGGACGVGLELDGGQPRGTVGLVCVIDLSGVIRGDSYPTADLSHL
jgi:hypothetical protein